MQQTAGHQRIVSPEERERRRRQRHEARASNTYGEFLALAITQLGKPRDEAARITLAVTTALKHRLPYDEMSDLESQLPYKLRELLDASEDISEVPQPREIKLPEFLALVARDLGISAAEAEPYVRAVFRLLAETVSRGEIEEVIHLLPRGLRQLWPALGQS
jgi:uncharacterized protein (DUF2267 family)